MDVAKWEIEGLEEERRRNARRRKNAAFRMRLQEEKRQYTERLQLKAVTALACGAWAVALYQAWS